MKKIAVLGAGTWGIVVGDLLVQNGNDVVIWGRDEKKMQEFNITKIHPKFKFKEFDKQLIFTSDMSFALDGRDVVIYAIPSTSFREVVAASLKYINNDKILITLTKGMEDNTLFTMSEIIEDELLKKNIMNDNIVALSGPTLAEEVMKKYPTTIVSASKEKDVASFVQDLFMNDYLRVYTNDDIKGVEVCGAFKNIIALASGIVYGLGYGDNIKAALLTRGIAEMLRVAEKMGVKKETFYGLAGMGDIIATATSESSRNFKCGMYIGKGFTVDEARAKVDMVVEGINFLPKALELKNKYKVDLPITDAMAEIIFNNKKPKEMLGMLMNRKKKSENVEVND